ncbi:CBO0543 family protein [Virgibacillus byunsanensis]|uniref:CBO0543 family protein n=1 Tax=Virgibacillus byunsanensis TaxID=570945 RepID=A0ABW3LLH6_9BACI
MHFLYNVLFLLAGFKWGDWKRWRYYYPTILFLICVDLLKNFLLYDYRMWTYQETFFGENILQNHTFINLVIMAIVYPSTVLIYLGRFPQERRKQIFWFSLWILIYWIVEYINLTYLDLINHHNDWNMWWSFLFLIVMFLMLKIHHKNPLLAWGLSVIFILILWIVFDIPVETLK